MPESHFAYDVFLSHSATDKAIVRAIAHQLRADGLDVWFDEWEIKPGDSIPAKIEEGLEQWQRNCGSMKTHGAAWSEA